MEINKTKGCRNSHGPRTSDQCGCHWFKSSSCCLCLCGKVCKSLMLVLGNFPNSSPGLYLMRYLQYSAKPDTRIYTYTDDVSQLTLVYSPNRIVPWHLSTSTGVPVVILVSFSTFETTAFLGVLVVVFTWTFVQDISKYWLWKSLENSGGYVLSELHDHGKGEHEWTKGHMSYVPCCVLFPLKTLQEVLQLLYTLLINV